MSRRIAALLLAVAASASGALHARPFDESDALNYQPEGAALFDPAGRRVVFERAEPYQEAMDFTSGGPFRQGRTSLWELDVAGRSPAKPLFEQAADTSYWLGSFAPDGARLAFVKLRHGMESLCIHEVDGGRVTCHDLSPEVFVYEPSFKWVSNTELLVILPAAGRQPMLLSNTRLSAEQLPALWARAWAGRETTADVVYSGEAAKRAPAHPGSLVRLNVVTGAIEPLALGTFVEMHVSPDRRYVALLKRHSIVARDPDVQLVAQETGQPPLSVEIVPLQGSSEARESFPACTECFVAGNNLIWSSDSRSIGFLAKSSHRPWPETVKAYRFDVTKRRMEEIAAGKLAVSVVRDLSTWGARGIFAAGTDFVFRARAVAVSGDKSPSVSAKLYSVSREGRIRELSGNGVDDGAEVIGTGAHAALLLKDGTVWRAGAGQRATRIKLPGKPSLLPGHWNTGSFYPRKSVAFEQRAWLRLEEAGRFTLASVAIDSGEVSLLPSLPSSVSSLGVDPSGKGALVIDEKTPSTVSLLSAQTPARPIMQLNAHMAGVELATVTRVAYTDAKGQPRHAWLYSPPKPSGAKLPLVVEVYGGAEFAKPSREWWQTYTVNTELLVAHGYAYLLVGVPISPEGAGSEPRLEMVDPVMRAVDAAIAAAPLDPERLALFGHSFGHFSALSVLSGTTRFKAAVIASGFTDAASHFGTFAAHLRVNMQDYLEYALFGSGWAEGGQGRMGSAPWQDPQRYVRNSPNFNVDKIVTPLMMMHGDLDEISMTQSEEMFTGLHRLNRDAQFVRYWGEGHLLLSPANLRDMWVRMEDWLRIHGVAPTPPH
ncbi:MAG: prolyl oligopeptidase family serine peptidase [Gammaproteobacteria bacterium]